jgi:uncharacterized protein YecT (DUF1311 family)
MAARALINVSFALLVLFMTGSSQTLPKPNEATRTAPAAPPPVDPCNNQHYCNVELRQCYTREQEKATREVKELVGEIASDFRKDDPILGPMIRGELRQAAKAVERSHNSWAIYRKQHCNAIAFSYTTGSGAGTAYEECMYRLAHQRIAELKTDFSH